MAPAVSPAEQLRAENADLRARLEEAEDTLRAIRTGEVDALIVETADGPQVFTLQGLDAESNRFRGEILAQVTDSVIAVDADERVTYLNAAAERQYGFSAGDAVGSLLSEIYTRRWPHTEAEGAMWAALREHSEWRGEMIHHTQDGRVITVETSVTALRDASGAPAGYVRVFHDISERKQAELELKRLQQSLEQRVAERTADLRESDEFSHQIISGAQEGIVVCDGEKRVRAWNPVMERMAGVAAEKIEGERVLGQFPFLRRGPLVKLLERALNGEVIEAPDQPYTLAGTSVKGWYAARLAPLRGGQNKITGVIITIRDITERKHAEVRLAEASTLLRNLTAHQFQLREDERTRIAREVHDELGGLLTAVQANVSVVIDRGARAGVKAHPELKQAWKMLRSASDSVRRIVADLRPSVLDQLGIWAALEWHVGEIAKSAGLACEIVIDDAAATTELDPECSTALFRIVQEALTNVVRHAAATQVALHVRRESDSIVGKVEDNGKGITEAQLNRKGNWGLIGMRERAHNFGGTVDFARGFAHGTIVVVRMPLKQASAPRGNR